ncbi:UNKNOWN [Stylonychia lemnae]|uniref:Kinase n=1 Tax=Stylonychia lemnae TaxID=5949 RepID=A0A077ZSM5_STYLE|nr:UNKNOWN [Stylonychia lemnae]|eukprot:CDW72872.1 UNKNOWN [Stylonychia lemnae]
MEQERNLEIDNLRNSIAGGHPDRFKYDPEHGNKVLAKKTNQFEIEAYQKIYIDDENHPHYKANIIFRNFLPKYHGHHEEDGEIHIKLDNLMFGMENASILDLKMGTSSITVNTPKKLYEKVSQKDAKTTSVSLGFRVTALIVKDEKGEIVEKIRKPHETVDASNMHEFIIKVLKSNSHPEVNREALDFFKLRAIEMLNYFKNHHARRIAGSSILLIVDNINKRYEMKIIDLSSCEDFEDQSKRDEGYILGIESLIQLFDRI